MPITATISRRGQSNRVSLEARQRGKNFKMSYWQRQSWSTYSLKRFLIDIQGERKKKEYIYSGTMLSLNECDSLNKCCSTNAQDSPDTCFDKCFIARSPIPHDKYNNCPFKRIENRAPRFLLTHLGRGTQKCHSTTQTCEELARKEAVYTLNCTRERNSCITNNFLIFPRVRVAATNTQYRSYIQRMTF